MTRIYYLLTPLFALIEYSAGIHLRLQTPWDSGLFDALYYLTCFIAGFFAFRSPLIGTLFALVECSINILFLLLSVMLPLAYLSEEMLSGQPVVFEFGPPQIAHFIIVGGILVWTFHSNEMRLRLAA